MILRSCTKWLDPETNRIDVLSDTIKDRIEEAIQTMAQSSLRTLCLAYKPINNHSNLEKKDSKGVFEIEKNELIMLCILGVRDIPRKEVPDAIAKCHKAGIKVRMVTGDNLITATAIARDVGIIKEGDNSIVMEGTEFMRLVGGVVCKNCRTKHCNCALDLKQAEEQQIPLRVDTIENGREFDKLKDNLLVLARSRPEDKYALVTGLKERGEVVAATGDGTNDAPALKKADVGFAMGIAGTEVAR
jgi:P-type Ca2+ transporter type 2B